MSKSESLDVCQRSNEIKGFSFCSYLCFSLVKIFQLLRCEASGLWNNYKSNNDRQSTNHAANEKRAADIESVEHGGEHLDGEEEGDRPDDSSDGGGGAPHREREQLGEEDPGHWAEAGGVTEADEDTGEDREEAEQLRGE